MAKHSDICLLYTWEWRLSVKAVSLPELYFFAMNLSDQIAEVLLLTFSTEEFLGFYEDEQS